MAELDGSISLEEAPTTPPTPEAPTLVGAVTDPGVQAPAPDDEAVPDGTIEGSGGVKFVPLAAVQEARGKAKEAKAEAERIKQENATLKATAQQFEQLKGYVEQARPYIEKAREDLAKPKAPEPEPAGPLTLQQAEAFAKDLDLYTPEGKPDVERAQRVAKLNASLVDQRTQEAIRPFQQQDAATKSAMMKQAVLTGPGKVKVDQKTLEQAWGIVPAELSARPEVASLLRYVSLGLMVENGMIKPGDTPVPPPVVETASLGGTPPAPGQSFTELDNRFARAAGISQADYKKTAERWKPGAVNSLEG